MKTKLNQISRLWVVFAFLGLVGLVPAVSSANSSDHQLPDEDDIFWQVMSAMDRPDDTTECQAKIDQLAGSGQLQSYIQTTEGIPGDSQQVAEMQQNFYQMCSMLASMPSQMQADMAMEGVTSNIFGMDDWHDVSGLYFEKAGIGKITFTNTLDFMSYNFFRFMNNFGNMVDMSNGVISLNAEMIPNMKNYGAQLTMSGLTFTSLPDIYVDGKLAGNSDIGDISYDPATGTLTFTAKHFSSYKAVAHGSKSKPMTIIKLNKKSIKYKAGKHSFKILVKGRNLDKTSSQTITCSLGFELASKVRIFNHGKKVSCTFPMSYFSNKGTFPLTISISGKGEVTKQNAFRVR